MTTSESVTATELVGLPLFAGLRQTDLEALAAGSVCRSGGTDRRYGGVCDGT